MPSTTPLAAALYRSLLKAARDCNTARVPLVGLAGFPQLPSLDFRQVLARRFRAAGSDLTDEGFRALRQVQAQRQVLLQCDEETRQALAAWHQLLKRWRSWPAAASGPAATPDAATAAPPAGVPTVEGQGTAEPEAMPLAQLCAALEEGALLVGRLHADIAPIGSLDDIIEDGDGDDSSAADSPGEAAGGALAPASASVAGQANGVLQSQAGTDAASVVLRQLDQLAERVALRFPGTFPAGAAAQMGSSGMLPVPRPPSTTRAQLEAISETLFSQLRYQHVPVEWVYDGLGPALLQRVLVRRNGIPMALALLYCCVARRLGVRAMPLLATAVRDTTQQGPMAVPSGMAGMPPEVAARQVGRIVAVAPTPDSWLVAAPDSDAQASLQGWLLADVDRRGRVMTYPEALARFPDLPEAFSLPPNPIGLWAHMARVMVTAHMRRGESDQVAHWLVQVLALDPAAPEWQVVLQPPQVQQQSFR